MANDIYTLARAQSIAAGMKFDADLKELLALLGQTEVQILSPGTAFHIYSTSGDLSTATVAEKAEIPDSGITATKGDDVVIDYAKYRNLVSIEQIGKLGYDIAVGTTNDKMIRSAEASVRTKICAQLATGTGTATAGATLQPALANAWAALNTATVDEAGDAVYFVNPTDAASYLGTANIGLSTAFGISYISNFLGLGTVIVDPGVTAGKVYATVTGNLNVVAADVTAISGMDLVTDELGILAVHNGAAYANGALETVVYSGVTVLPTALDHIIIGTIGA